MKTDGGGGAGAIRGGEGGCVGGGVSVAEMTQRQVVVTRATRRRRLWKKEIAMET